MNAKGEVKWGAGQEVKYDMKKVRRRVSKTRRLYDQLDGIKKRQKGRARRDVIRRGI